jgi:two-component system response regulator CpxR
MTESNAKSILLVDDDLDLCQLLTEYLTIKGFVIRQAHDGLSALKMVRAAEESFDLMILDVMMPVMDGFQVLKEMRSTGLVFPVIMLTAKGDPDDRIAGLELGADDYLPKPFEPRELLARIQAVMRRVEPGPETAQDRVPSLLAIDDLELNAGTYEASSRGRPLHLTPAEFRLLWLLVLKPGAVVARDRLFQEALGREENLFDRSLDIHISRLRKKIGPGHNGADRLKSIRGEGYLYVQIMDE